MTVLALSVVSYCYTCTPDQKTADSFRIIEKLSAVGPQRIIDVAHARHLHPDRVVDFL